MQCSRYENALPSLITRYENVGLGGELGEVDFEIRRGVNGNNWRNCGTLRRTSCGYKWSVLKPVLNNTARALVLRDKKC